MAIRNVAIVGCGLIGKRRAEVAASATRSAVVLFIDKNPSVAKSTAEQYGVAWSTNWIDCTSENVDVVVVATPNAFLAEIAIAALESGKHVLIEKPMGRNLAEAEALVRAAAMSKGLLKVGFNHRYHPALLRAKSCFDSGAIGDLMHIRARYGHGGRPGYESEWRGNPALSGGGELTDQGVHILDLLQWFAGEPKTAYCVTQTTVWPIAPLEDNAFALLTYSTGVIASFHSTWTQWKNIFSFEVFGTTGALIVEGLGKSYGVERLTELRRNMKGGVPESTETIFDGRDDSWLLEWEQLLDAIELDLPYFGDPKHGAEVMRVLDALYRSADLHVPVNLS